MALSHSLQQRCRSCYRVGTASPLRRLAHVVNAANIAVVLCRYRHLHYEAGNRRTLRRFQPLVVHRAPPIPQVGLRAARRLPRKKWAYPNAFTNISVTTIECSVVCPRPLVDELFVPLIERLDAKAKQAVIISNDDFVVLQVGGEGMEAGQRVLDLTAPLALAGM